MFWSDFYGEFESDKYEGIELVAEYEVDYENGKSVNKCVKDEVNLKTDGSEDWGIKYWFSVEVVGSVGSGVIKGVEKGVDAEIGRVIGDWVGNYVRGAVDRYVGAGVDIDVGDGFGSDDSDNPIVIHWGCQYVD